METNEVKTPIIYLNEQKTKFNKVLVDNLLDYKRHIQHKENDPEYVTKNQDGAVLSVDDALEIYKMRVVNAREYLKIIDELLEAYKGDIFNDLVNKVEFVKSPINSENIKE